MNILHFFYHLNYLHDKTYSIAYLGMPIHFHDSLYNLDSLVRLPVRRDLDEEDNQKDPCGIFNIIPGGNSGFPGLGVFSIRPRAHRDGGAPIRHLGKRTDEPGLDRFQPNFAFL
jgi:hypothetical protein